MGEPERLADLALGQRLVADHQVGVDPPIAGATPQAALISPHASAKRRRSASAGATDRGALRHHRQKRAT
jgi:hypothetical protein